MFKNIEIMLVKTGTGNSKDRTPRFKCPECGHKMYIPLKNPVLAQCSKCKLTREPIKL